VARSCESGEKACFAALATRAEKWKRKSGEEAEEAEKHLALTWHGHY
jgi:hypothetical protein